MKSRLPFIATILLLVIVIVPPMILYLRYVKFSSTYPSLPRFLLSTIFCHDITLTNYRMILHLILIYHKSHSSFLCTTTTHLTTGIILKSLPSQERYKRLLPLAEPINRPRVKIISSSPDKIQIYL